MCLDFSSVRAVTYRQIEVYGLGERLNGRTWWISHDEQRASWPDSTVDSSAFTVWALLLMPHHGPLVEILDVHVPHQWNCCCLTTMSLRQKRRSGGQSRRWLEQMDIVTGSTPKRRQRPSVCYPLLQVDAFLQSAIAAAATFCQLHVRCEPAAIWQWRISSSTVAIFCCKPSCIYSLDGISRNNSYYWLL